MSKQETSAKNLSDNLKRLSEITKWFDNQEEIDIEQGLEKTKEAAGLIKASRERLKAIENEFEEIKKEVSPSKQANPSEQVSPNQQDNSDNLDL